MKLLFLFFVNIIMLSSPFVCAAEKVKSSNKMPLQRLQSTEMNTIVFVDHALNRTILKKSSFSKKKKHHKTIKVDVHSAGAGQTATGLLKVWVVLRNRTDFPLQIEGQTSFYDSSEAPVDIPPMWKRIYLPANSTARYQELATSFDSTKFVVEMREGR